MKKFDWKKYIYKIAVVILVIFFVGGVGIGAANILSIEGTEELYTATAPLTPYPDTTDEIIAYVNSCIAKANTEQPKLTYSESYKISDGDAEFVGENENDANAVKAVFQKTADTIEEKIEDSFEKSEIEFYSANSDILRKVNLDTENVISAVIDYEYCTCTMCGEKISIEDYGEICPECGNEGTLRERYDDVYKITITVANADNNTFPKTENLEEVLVSGSVAGSDYTLENFAKTDTEYRIYAEINRLTDKINTLQFITDSDVTADICHNYDGSAHIYNVRVPVTDKYKFDFTWPGLELNLHTYQVEAKSTNVLKATLSCDDPTAYDVEWSSSDESIVTVDSEGYIKSGKTLGEAVITAKFTFGGVEYTDECLVIVCVPAEGMDLSKGKLSLKTGDSFTLQAEMDPSDTTNTLVYWFTEDENIATVDENGTVTAVSPGNVTIYAISDDGNYYSSCTVEVTDNG